MLIQYFHFTRWANNLVVAALNDLERIDQAEYLLSHILNAHRIWNARVLGEQPEVLAFDSVGRSMWDSVDQENYHKTLQILGDLNPATMISYENSKGDAFETRVEDIFLHLANHSTHHRGQLVALMRKMGAKPPVTDYIAWVRAGKPVPE
jgi:uncharacterized damage-inducible protein DinB